MEQNSFHLRGRIITLAVFAIAMAFLEAAVVVYLRELYYPEGFSFPLKMIPPKIYTIELGREAATIMMLAAVGWFSGRNFTSRFAGFAMAFGVWDIFYYLFLKITLDWPSGVLDWDLLFLIPLPWLGPVLAPIIVSIFLIAAGVAIWRREARHNPIIISKRQWLIISFAGLIIIGSFLTNTTAMLEQTTPQSFRWDVFTIGLLLGLAAFSKSITSVKRKKN